MTNKKAIEVLKVMKSAEELMLVEDEQEALDLAIQALEKQEPKKPINYQHNHLNGFRCFKCNKVVHSKYCSNCGQAIDWSNNE